MSRQLPTLASRKDFAEWPRWLVLTLNPVEVEELGVLPDYPPPCKHPPIVGTSVAWWLAEPFKRGELVPIRRRLPSSFWARYGHGDIRARPEPYGEHTHQVEFAGCQPIL